MKARSRHAGRKEGPHLATPPVQAVAQQVVGLELFDETKRMSRRQRSKLSETLLACRTVLTESKASAWTELTVTLPTAVAAPVPARRETRTFSRQSMRWGTTSSAKSDI